MPVTRLGPRLKDGLSPETFSMIERIVRDHDKGLIELMQITNVNEDVQREANLVIAATGVVMLHLQVISLSGTLTTIARELLRTTPLATPLFVENEGYALAIIGRHTELLNTYVAVIA